MAWMTVDGDTGRTVWRDRTTARPTTDTRVKRVGREWLTVEPARQTMTDWRGASSRVTTEVAQ